MWVWFKIILGPRSAWFNSKKWAIVWTWGCFWPSLPSLPFMSGWPLLVNWQPSRHGLQECLQTSGLAKAQEAALCHWSRLVKWTDVVQWSMTQDPKINGDVLWVCVSLLPKQSAPWALVLAATCLQSHQRCVFGAAAVAGAKILRSRVSQLRS